MAVQAKPLFGRYTDAELIGAGVIGEVYRATDSLLGRVVAVRVLARRFNDDLTVRQRFIRETLAAAPLSAHPHTVTLYDVGDWEGQAYAVMAYLPRGSLEERLQQEGAQPPDQVIVWIDQVAATLDAAHEAGIAHGEVKPANLRLDAQGDVQLAEFGAAGALPLAHGSPAGDRYALGIVAFELLSGRRPRGAEPVSAANASLPRELDAVFATKGEYKDGVYKATFGRTTKMAETDVGNAMGVNTWAAFAGTDDGAVVDGDFAMLESELQTVLKTLRKANIRIVAIHQHMTTEQPRIMFLHFWGTGKPEELASGIKAALDTQAK